MQDKHGQIDTGDRDAGGVNTGSIVPNGHGGSVDRNAVVHELSEQARAARSLVESMRSLFGDDDEIIETAVEGETDLHEAISSALQRLAELSVLQDSLTEMISSMQERKGRLSKQSEAIRTAMGVAMEWGNLKRLELPLGTVSLRAVAPSVEVTDESAIPSAYWTPQPPKLDKRELLKALKSGAVLGASLTPPSTTISVRYA